MQSEATNLQIGARVYSGSEGFFNGSIDEVNVWNRSLSSTEVRELYEEGLNNYEDVKDYSTNGNTGEVVGATWNRTGGINNSGAYEFNGSLDEYIQSVETVAIPQKYTLSTWINGSLSDQIVQNIYVLGFYEKVSLAISQGPGPARGGRSPRGSW